MSRVSAQVSLLHDRHSRDMKGGWRMILTGGNAYKRTSDPFTLLSIKSIIGTTYSNDKTAPTAQI